MTQSVLDAVRAATLSDHKRTEDTFTATLSALPASYSAYLLIHAAAFPAIGRALSAQFHWTPWLERWTDLQGDLQRLGLEPPTPLEIMPAASAAEALGMTYVLEGSRMGSAIILKSIPENLPTAYLRGGADVAPWRRLKQILIDADPRGAQGVIAGARYAFTAFRTAALPGARDAA